MVWRQSCRSQQNEDIISYYLAHTSEKTWNAPPSVILVATNNSMSRGNKKIEQQILQHQFHKNKYVWDNWRFRLKKKPHFTTWTHSTYISHLNGLNKYHRELPDVPVGVCQEEWFFYFFGLFFSLKLKSRKYKLQWSSNRSHVGRASACLVSFCVSSRICF